MSLRPQGSDSSWSEVRATPGGFPPSPNLEPQSGVISAPHSLHQAVKARRQEYVREKELKIKVGTWNVGSASGADKDLGSWFVDGMGVKGLSEDLAGLAVESSSNSLALDGKIESVAEQEERRRRKTITLPKNDVSAVPGGREIDLYVLGLQEVVDIASATEALRPYTDPNPGKKWKKAVESALPSNYAKVAEQQLLGMLILIYASPRLVPEISSVSATSVGTGLMGYLGNKGAVSVRLMLGQTTKLVFVNCHLAAGADQASLNRRIWDTSQILTRTRFAPITEDDEVTQEFGDSIGDEDFAFWFGDLNYRLDDIPGDDVRRLLLLHTRNEYDVENKSKRKIDSELGYINAPSEESLPRPSNTHSEVDNLPLDPKDDPASLHTTLQSLLQHDQLRGQQRLRKVFHEGWQEGDINFLPTYKYDIGSVGMFDSGEKKRSPSWCDRILYRSRKHKRDYDHKIKEEQETRKKDNEMKANGLDQITSENDVLFDYNPDDDGLTYGDDYDENEDAVEGSARAEPRADSEESIILDHYISHQRVLSSDHKPLDAIFTLTYDAIIPELKARVHKEVARDLDKAENEGRPGVTLVVDNHAENTNGHADDTAEQSSLTGIDFGEVRFGVPQSRGLTIANTGQIPATFGFIDRAVEAGQKGGVTPPWLGLQVDRESNNANQNATALKEYTLQPGDTAYVSLTASVSHFKMVHDFNVGKLHVDDTLVLRIMKGRDHFIPVHGVWMQSCFCRSLDELVRIPDGGIRHMQESHPQIFTHQEAGNGDQSHGMLGQLVRHSAPRELFVLTEAIQQLSERAIAEWEMTHTEESPPWKRESFGSSWPFDHRTWTLEAGQARSRLTLSAREALDTASPFQDTLPSETSTLVRLEVFAETLLAFLTSLDDGILTSSLWPDLENQIIEREKTSVAVTPDEEQSATMEVLSIAPAHSVSFTFIVFMLTRMINELVPAVPTAPASPRLNRLSMSSTQSGQSEEASDASMAAALSPGKASFFPSLRRRTTDTRSSTGMDDTVQSSAVDRREVIRQAYLEVFTNLIIRSEKDSYVRGKEKKLLESRKRRVLEVFL